VVQNEIVTMPMQGPLYQTYSMAQQSFEGPGMPSISTRVRVMGEKSLSLENKASPEMIRGLNFALRPIFRHEVL
jgi:hypothetical protein